MKVETRYGSMWDELPERYRGRVPQTQEEGRDFYEAAEESVTDSLMKTMDGRAEMMRRSAELRRIEARRRAVEEEAQDRREEQTEFLKQKA